MPFHLRELNLEVMLTVVDCLSFEHIDILSSASHWNDPSTSKNPLAIADTADSNSKLERNPSLDDIMLNPRLSSVAAVNKDINSLFLLTFDVRNEWDEPFQLTFDIYNGKSVLI
jgi:hypothetical protein